MNKQNMFSILEKLRPRSLAQRLALASALFGLIVAIGAMAVGYWTLSKQLDDRSASEMEGRRQLLTHILSEVPTVTTVAVSASRFSELFYGHDDLHLALVEPAGGAIVASFSETGAEAVDALRKAAVGPRGLHSWRKPNGARYSGIHGTATVKDGGPVDFYLAVDRMHDTRLLAGFVKSTVIALPLLLLMVAAGAGLITKTGLAPLRRFNQLAASIGTSSLNQRLSMAGLPVELAAMATEFNAMLERIDKGYRQLEDFSGDLAHEMRTPVATLLGRTQVALSHGRTAAELRDVLEGNVEELERLATLISDMLFIARTESKGEQFEVEPVDLAREAERVVEYLSLAAEEKVLTFRVTGCAPPITADRLMVQRAVTNLLSNAVRHASEQSTVDINVVAGNDYATLAVSNVGEGIAAADQQRIFDRFYRLDASRSRGQGGSGLGLAIVKSIMLLHGGSVAVCCEAGRTTFTLRFPMQIALQQPEMARA